MSQVMTKTGIYDILGQLLIYPTEDISRIATECRESFQTSAPEAASAVEGFGEYVEKSTLAAMQEAYTRTFEINPVCALEVGWQLFGERYERGTFIVKMRQTLRSLDLPESTELPDHLSHVLQALDRLNPDEAAEFAGLFVAPAVEKMIEGFKDNSNIYRDVLSGILCEVRSQYNLPAQGAQDD